MTNDKREKTRHNVLVLGGGASGLTAAILCRENAPEADVTILEREEEPGRKIRATGNGRCNLSNVRCRNVSSVLAFFERIGVRTRTDGEGRIYPYSEDAADVADALTDRARETGVRIETGVRAVSAERTGTGFSVLAEKKGETIRYESECLILAAGGKAGPQFGTTGDGAVLARKLGLRVTRLAPALTGIELSEDVSCLAGVRAKADVLLRRGGDEVCREHGEIQFTKYGISGIVVFDLSRLMTLPAGTTLADGFRDYRIEIDFYPGGTDLPGTEELPAERRLRSIVRRPLAEYVAARSREEGIAPERMIHQVTFCPKGLRGWKMAQVTRGGISESEYDPETMEVKTIPGLFAAGEVVDYDGPCGGFNLQHAWESGMRAGISCAERLKDMHCGRETGRKDMR